MLMGMASINQQSMPMGTSPPTTPSNTGHTPSRTSKTAQELPWLINSLPQRQDVLNTPCKRKVDMLHPAAENAFADRAIILHENQQLFSRSMEKKLRKSRRMAVLGTTRVMSYQDLYIARNVLEQQKTNNERLANKRAKRATELQENSNMQAGSTIDGEDLETPDASWL